jgi:hypothetical protein
MENEIIASLGTIIVALGGALGWQQRRNGKNGNPGIGAHLARLETLAEQQVRATEQASIALTAIQVTLATLEATVGTCGAVQVRQRGG